MPEAWAPSRLRAHSHRTPKDGSKYPQGPRQALGRSPCKRTRVRRGLHGPEPRRPRGPTPPTPQPAGAPADCSALPLGAKGRCPRLSPPRHPALAPRTSVSSAKTGPLLRGPGTRWGPGGDWRGPGEGLQTLHSHRRWLWTARTHSGGTLRIPASLRRIWPSATCPHGDSARRCPGPQGPRPASPGKVSARAGSEEVRGRSLQQVGEAGEEGPCEEGRHLEQGWPRQDCSRLGFPQGADRAASGPCRLQTLRAPSGALGALWAATEPQGTRQEQGLRRPALGGPAGGSPSPHWVWAESRGAAGSSPAQACPWPACHCHRPPARSVGAGRRGREWPLLLFGFLVNCPAVTPRAVLNNPILETSVQQLRCVSQDLLHLQWGLQ